MYGDMKSYRLFAVTLFLSLLLHILIIFFVKFVYKQPEVQDVSNGKPVEIEVIPKAKENLYSDLPLTDDEDTTLDHDINGGKSSASIDDSQKTEESLLKSDTVTSNNINDNIKLPKEENNKRDNIVSNESNLPNKLNLYDNKDIIDKIANAKKTQPKGEDSASYNVFEERYASYFAKFRRRVYQLWEYPIASIQKGETGVVKLSFSILKDGYIINIRMLESSGYPNLDREVMRVIKNMGKIPLPESYELNQLNVEEAYFIYSIGNGYSKFLE